MLDSGGACLEEGFPVFGRSSGVGAGLVSSKNSFLGALSACVFSSWRESLPVDSFCFAILDKPLNLLLRS